MMLAAAISKLVVWRELPMFIGDDANIAIIDHAAYMPST